MATGINLAISQASRESMLVDTIDGELDMVLGVFPEQISKELRTHTLFEERFVCLADAATLPTNGELDITSWFGTSAEMVMRHIIGLAVPLISTLLFNHFLNTQSPRHLNK